MLTDIFAERYATTPMWEAFRPNDKKLLMQAFRIVAEQLFPYYYKGEEATGAKETWKSLHDRLSMELGVEELSKRYYAYQNPGGSITTGSHTYETVCKNFVCADYNNSTSADEFIKQRISFIEIAFREQSERLAAGAIQLEKNIKNHTLKKLYQIGGGIRLPGDFETGQRAHYKSQVDKFNGAVEELNIRLRTAGYNLNYHNGFIQVSTDYLIERQVKEPFWRLVAAPNYANIEKDMLAALDLRDTGGMDPAFFAARALESAVKILSDDRGVTTGNENGASAYIDGLASKRGNHLISLWEADSLKAFFKNVRNPMSHGAGSQQAISLTGQQTDWAIEFCMIWVRSLLTRH